MFELISDYIYIFFGAMIFIINVSYLSSRLIIFSLKKIKNNQKF